MQIGPITMPFGYEPFVHTKIKFLYTQIMMEAINVPCFTLRLNKTNLRIAEAIKNAVDGVKVDVREDGILVSFDYGLNISRLELGSVGMDLTPGQWNALAREIKKTLVGAKVREFNSMLIGIHPLKTERIDIRLDPLEKALIVDAARIEQKSITDFIRTAALRLADEVFDRETAKKMQEREGVRDEQAYVS